MLNFVEKYIITSFYDTIEKKFGTFLSVSALKVLGHTESYEYSILYFSSPLCVTKNLNKNILH